MILDRKFWIRLMMLAAKSGTKWGGMACLAIAFAVSFSTSINAQSSGSAGQAQQANGRTDPGIANNQQFGVQTNGQGRGVAVKSKKT